ncbi:MAG TPA: adenylate/guanylate cyclase domain-containing protein [Acidimicrobiia bacterium]
MDGTLGRLDGFTLRFLDDDLEHEFQREEGAAGLAGYRIITLATVVLWAIAAFVLPIGTTVTVANARIVSGIMLVVGSIAFFASYWASTVDRQHGLASILTTANGLVILFLAYLSDFLAGYAVAAISLLYLFGFVSRTRFVYALVRTAAIVGGFAYVVAITPGRFAFDTFILISASAASLVGLRMIERNRRTEWHQRLVIEHQRAALEAEQAESERLLLNVLPEAISKRLRSGESNIADDFPAASVIFADIVGFTPMAAELNASEVITMLSEIFSIFDDLVTERGLEKIKTIGDSYMAVGGVPEFVENHAYQVVDLAVAMLEDIKKSARCADMALRIGIHSGPLAGGVIGRRTFAYDVWGNTVNVAARLETSGVPGRIHVSEATKKLTKEAFDFELRGDVELRGIGTMSTYLLVG